MVARVCKITPEGQRSPQLEAAAKYDKGRARRDDRWWQVGRSVDTASLSRKTYEGGRDPGKRTWPEAVCKGKSRSQQRAIGYRVVVAEPREEQVVVGCLGQVDERTTKAGRYPRTSLVIASCQTTAMPEGAHGGVILWV